jgi:predicted MFS family arabinose efflux permease
MLLIAVACGLIVANIYYVQPLAGPIGVALGLSAAATGLVVTLTQVGFGAGLVFIVPLGDLVENKRLILSAIGLASLALLGAGLASHPMTFLSAAFCIGLGSVAVQVLVPYVSHMAPEAIRGRVVGNVMSGVMLGIMLARPVASFIAQLLSWHAVFLFSGAAMIAVAAVLALALPPRVPSAQLPYAGLLISMGRIAVATPILQRRALYHACLFAAFSLFWTTVPLWLAGPQFGLSQGGIGLFALAGVAGAIAAPIAGRVADRGWTRAATAFAMLAAIVAFLMTRVALRGSSHALAILVAAAVVLDFGVAGNLTLGQRAIFALGSEYRSRVNGIYMATFFIGGAIGSLMGGWAYARGGWPLASWVGLALPLIALLYYSTERTPISTPR